MPSQARLFLLLLVTSAATGTFVFVRKYHFWEDALKYCRTHHTDLAQILSEHDTNQLRVISGGYDRHAWFGLMRNTSSASGWMWSAGGEVTTFFWESGQPQNQAAEKYGLLIDYRWHDAENHEASYFYCNVVTVVRQEKTWEDAMEYCRSRDQDLASISSESEVVSIQNELSKENSTEHVWVGLRFLSEDWLWLDGHSWGDEAWGDGGKPECPIERSCGALMVNSQAVTEWKAFDCQKRLHFVCD